MNDDKRPNPDELLSQIRAQEEGGKRRGRLKIFFGSSAGVGKTYAMLSAAREELEKGRNVLVGLVETHGRPETERLLEGLLLMQPLEISYRGLRLKEFDLETALTRKPDIILVDELAHTNAPGSRHPKRWNDVVELLNAGIDVFTTLNVQHIESLSDIVSGTTGIWMKETVPDTVFDMAEDVVLVDIDEDDLIRRLNEGKVYVAPGAKARAAEHFFKKSNLSALREMALRRTAERVDAERKTGDASARTYPIADNILVCIGLNSLSAKLLRTTKRMANALKAPWTALYVDDSGASRLPEAKSRYLESLESMVERMGGKTVMLHGDDVTDEIISYARKNRFSKIVVGKNLRLSLRHLLRGYTVDRIIRKSGAIDIYVVTDEREKGRDEQASPVFPPLKPLDYLLTFLTALGFTIPGAMLPGILTQTDQALLYFVGTILVAQTFGVGPSVFYAVLTSVLFNLLFLEPTHAFSFHSGAYYVTFAVMLCAGSLVALRIARLHGRMISSRDREDKMRALYTLTRALSATRGRFPVSEVAGKFIEETYDVAATVWMTNSEGHPAVVLGNLPEETYYKDFGALQWCFENAQNAGRGTSTMPSAAGFYLPLTSSGGNLGVIGIYPKSEDRLFTKEEIASFETISSLLASALDRVRAGEIARQIMVEKEEEKTAEDFAPSLMEPSSDALLALKFLNPLADLGPASGPEPLPPVQAVQSLVTFFGEDQDKQLNRRPASLLDRITRVKGRLAPDLGRRRIDVRLPVDLPDVLIDANMIEQALFDLLSFAVRRSPPLGAVRIEAKRTGSDILVTLADKGPNLPPRTLESLFDRLEAAEATEKQQEDLSLSIAAGLIRLQGGAIQARNRAITGLKIAFTLPIA